MAEKKREETVETVQTPKPEERVTVPTTQIQEPDQPPEMLAPALTPEEIDEIKAKARKTLEKERKQHAKDDLFERELKRLQDEEGFSTGGVGDQMVSITIDLYPGADRIVLDSKPYFHAQTYAVKRKVADTLREIMWRGWDQERIRKGESLRDLYGNPRHTTLSSLVGARNAPRPAA